MTAEESLIENAANWAASPYWRHSQWDDVLQCGRIGAWKGLRRWRADGGASRETHARNWASSEIKHYLRRGSNIIRVPCYRPVGDGPRVTESLDDPDWRNKATPVSEDVDQLAVRLALDGLTPQSREVLQLVVIEGFYQTDYARFLGLSAPAVWGRFRRAKNAMRRALIAQGVHS